MKLMIRSNTYKASNVSFNVATKEAYSYDWWCFFKVINGKNVFNSYNYSPTTIKHQYKIRTLLRELNINIDLNIECPAGLQDLDCGISIDKHYSYKIAELKAQIAKPRSQSKKNKEREQEIQQLAQKCVEFKLL